MRAWRNADYTIVTPSRWLARCAEKSPITKNAPTRVIANGIETSTFRPHEKKFARSTFGLPLEKKLILFGASNENEPNKGGHLLLPALMQLADSHLANSIAVACFGPNIPRGFEKLPFPVYGQGYLHDSLTLALLYSAADVFVAPSMQDNLPNTIVEALSCGCPSVGFDIGGIPDLIIQHKTGYLAPSFETDQLSRGIEWVLENDARRETLAANAREKALRDYSIQTQSQTYLHLFQEVVNRSDQ